MTGKANCWDLKKCGRETGGAKVDELGVCPAATDTSIDGKNSGKNGGRICWLIAGTICGGQKQGIFAEKRISCISCEVLAQIQKEEGSNFRMK